MMGNINNVPLDLWKTDIFSGLTGTKNMTVCTWGKECQTNI